jgi:hypothetical protein
VQQSLGMIELRLRRLTALTSGSGGLEALDRAFGSATNARGYLDALRHAQQRLRDLDAVLRSTSRVTDATFARLTRLQQEAHAAVHDAEARRHLIPVPLRDAIDVPSPPAGTAASPPPERDTDSRRAVQPIELTRREVGPGLSVVEQAVAIDSKTCPDRSACLRAVDARWRRTVSPAGRGELSIELQNICREPISATVWIEGQVAVAGLTIPPDQRASRTYPATGPNWVAAASRGGASLTCIDSLR